LRVLTRAVSRWRKKRGDFRDFETDYFKWPTDFVEQLQLLAGVPSAKRSGCRFADFGRLFYAVLVADRFGLSMRIDMTSAIDDRLSTTVVAGRQTAARFARLASRSMARSGATTLAGDGVNQSVCARIPASRDGARRDRRHCASSSMQAYALLRLDRPIRR
jgi:hypothetical protein